MQLDAPEREPGRRGASDDDQRRSPGKQADRQGVAELVTQDGERPEYPPGQEDTEGYLPQRRGTARSESQRQTNADDDGPGDVLEGHRSAARAHRLEIDTVTTTL